MLAACLHLRTHVWRALLVPLLVCVAAASADAQATKQYPVTGMVVSVTPASRTFTASIQAIPNFMAAMTMPFEVKSGEAFQGLSPGVVVSFTLVVGNDDS